MAILLVLATLWSYLFNSPYLWESHFTYDRHQGLKYSSNIELSVNQFKIIVKVIKKKIFVKNLLHAFALNWLDKSAFLL